jgi:hypothetical protein
MDCIKLKDFDKENSNYDYLVTAIQEGKVRLNEDTNKAFIESNNLEIKFPLGMKVYLESLGYQVFINRA